MDYFAHLGAKMEGHSSYFVDSYLDDPAPEGEKGRLLGGAGEEDSAVSRTLSSVAGLAMLNCLLYSVLAFAIALVGLCCAEIWAYTKYKDDLCAEPLPIWLLVGGIGGLLWVISFGISHKTAAVTGAVSCGLTTLACFAWQIVGSVWVYQMSDDECPPVAYHMVWYTVTVFWVLIGIIVTIVMTCMISTICCDTPEKQGYSIQDDVQEQEMEPHDIL